MAFKSELEHFSWRCTVCMQSPESDLQKLSSASFSLGISQISFLFELFKHKNHTHRRQTTTTTEKKILMEAWRRVVSVHQCFNSAFFLTENRAYKTLLAWLPSGNKMIWGAEACWWMLGGHHLDHRRSKPVVLDLAVLNVLKWFMLTDWLLFSFFFLFFYGIQNQLFCICNSNAQTVRCFIWPFPRAFICIYY